MKFNCNLLNDVRLSRPLTVFGFLPKAPLPLLVLLLLLLTWLLSGSTPTTTTTTPTIAANLGAKKIPGLTGVDWDSKFRVRLETGDSRLETKTQRFWFRFSFRLWIQKRTPLGATPCWPPYACQLAKIESHTRLARWSPQGKNHSKQIFFTKLFWETLHKLSY